MEAFSAAPSVHLEERPPPMKSPQAGEQAGSENKTTTRDATTGDRLTVKQMAQLAGVSERLIAMIIKVHRIGIPDLLDLMLDGTLSGNSALKIAMQPHAEQHRIVAGIRAGKPVKVATANLQCVVDGDGYAGIVSAWNRATEEGRNLFLDRIIQQASE